MTDLIINGAAARHSSLGARRYFEGVMAHLDWPGRIITSAPAHNPWLVRMKELADRGRPDAIYWSPAHRGPWFAHNHVVTVLDCINIEHVYAHDWKLPILRTAMARLLDNALAIVAISNATKSAILRNFDVPSDKIRVLAGPTDLINSNAEFSLHAASDPFVLMVTNALPHKNTAVAGVAFAASSAARRGIGLRVVGAMAEAGRAACAAAGVQLSEHRGIDDATLDGWLREARFLLSPSLDEGLNLPIAEALSRGTNVLCSDIAVHREFYAGQVAFFDPAESGSLRIALNTAFDRPGRWYVPQARPEFGIAGIARAYRNLFLSLA